MTKVTNCSLKYSTPEIFLAKVEDTLYEQKNAGSLLSHIAEKGLRYDLTVPFARFVVQHRNDIHMPFRRYQIQPVWRADNPQKGRYREFWQCDADAIGSDSLVNETDLLLIYEEVFSLLNLQAQVYINHRKVLEGFAEIAGVRHLFKEITVCIDKTDKIGIEGVTEELLKAGLTLEQCTLIRGCFEQFELSNKGIELLADKLKTSVTGMEGINELTELLGLCEAAGLKKKPVFNGTLARGLDYYTGCIFEAVSTEVKIGSISGGGRYANLTGVFGMDGLSGVGISFGIDRIYDVLESLNRFAPVAELNTTVLCCFFNKNGQMEALRTASDLRKKGIAAEVYPDLKKIQKQFEYAGKRQIPYVVVWGDNEISSGIPMVKNMITGQQQSMHVEELIKQLS